MFGELLLTVQEKVRTTRLKRAAALEPRKRGFDRLGSDPEAIKARLRRLSALPGSKQQHMFTSPPFASYEEKDRNGDLLLNVIVHKNGAVQAHGLSRRGNEDQHVFMSYQPGRGFHEHRREPLNGGPVINMNPSKPYSIYSYVAVAPYILQI